MCFYCIILFVMQMFKTPVVSIHDISVRQICVTLCHLDGGVIIEFSFQKKNCFFIFCIGTFTSCIFCFCVVYHFRSHDTLCPTAVLCLHRFIFRHWFSNQILRPDCIVTIFFRNLWKIRFTEASIICDCLYNIHIIFCPESYLHFMESFRNILKFHDLFITFFICNPSIVDVVNSIKVIAHKNVTFYLALFRHSSCDASQTFPITCDRRCRNTVFHGISASDNASDIILCIYITETVTVGDCTDTVSCNTSGIIPGIRFHRAITFTSIDQSKFF